MGGEDSTSEAITSEEDVMKILVASDIHLGYCEKDPVRGEDSYIAFEEILQTAVEKQVDFILLGGDLFHEAAPSQYALHKCLSLLRKYTLGDKPINLEFLSDQSVNFGESHNQTVNYEDPNLNVAIPVFSIHGNHDDPSGYGRLSSLDILSTSGLVNYFGRWIDLTKVNISPILLKKGQTHLALHGLSHIHDARLSRLFQTAKVVMQEPDPKTGDWFNIMVLHQNRAERGVKNYVPEDILPDFLDLIIWGHEHDSRIIPEENCKKKFFVCQPGSSVATSLSEGEALDKHCGLLMIYKKKFKLEPIRLKTVRPFIFQSLSLGDYIEDYQFDQGDVVEKVMKIATDKIESILTQAEGKLSGHEKQPMLPLIRLRIVYSEEEQMFNAIRFGQQYNGRVANPMDMVLFKRITKKIKHDNNKTFDNFAMDDAYEHEALSHETRVEQVIERYFEEVDDDKRLQVMPSKILSEMCWRLVERNDINAAENIIQFCKDKANEFLMETLPNEDHIDEELRKFQSKATELHDEMLKKLDERGFKKQSADSFIIDDTTESSEVRTTTRGSTRGRRAGGATARGRGRGRGRGSKAQSSNSSQFEMTKTPQNQSSLQISQASSRTRAKTITYEISSDSE